MENTFNITNTNFDLSFFTDEVESLQYELNLMEQAYDVLDEALTTLVSQSHLENIKFKPVNADAFCERAYMDGYLSDIVFSGEDDEYRYFILAKCCYELDEDEDYDDDDDFCLCSGEEETYIASPDFVYSSLIRTKKDNTDATLYSYDFDTDEWNELDICELLSVTPSQLDMLKALGQDADGKSELFFLYYHASGKLVKDDEFEKFYQKNKPLVDLYDKLNGPVGFYLMDDSSVCITTALDCTGMAVTYENGVYKVKVCIIEEVLFEAMSMKNIDEASEMLNSMMGYMREDDVLVPLSKTAFSLIDDNGECKSYSTTDTRLTEKEQNRLNDFIEGFIKAVSALIDMEEEDEEEDE